MKPRIHIDAPGPTARNVVVTFTDRDGNDHDISHILTGATIHLDVNEPNRVDLHAILVGGRYNAELDHLKIEAIGPSRIRRLAWRIRRWWRNA